MNQKHRQELIDIAKQQITSDDSSHDFLHAFRILNLAERISKREKGDPDIIVPAALFHDAVVYPKDDPHTAFSQRDSARAAKMILKNLRWFPKEKIPAVERAITLCSFTKKLPKETIEDHIIQDADMLESTGAIAIARTFSSGALMKRAFYNPNDPRGIKRIPGQKYYDLNLFTDRLFKAKNRLFTKTAKKMCVRRDKFVHKFYKEFLKDIAGK